MRKISMDIAWDEDTETFPEILENVGKAFPSVFVRVNQFRGSGGGWPDVTFLVADDEIDGLLEFFGYDEFDREWMIAESDPV